MVAVFFMAFLVVWLFGTLALYACVPGAAIALRQAAFFPGQEAIRGDERARRHPELLRFP
jgi:hypothetical protein